MPVIFRSCSVSLPSSVRWLQCAGLRCLPHHSALVAQAYLNGRLHEVPSS